MMLPEGTRSPTGRVRACKTGAFELAQRTRSTILPIVLEGTADALPKRGFVLQGRHPIRITVLNAIPLREFGDVSAEELTQRVHDLIGAFLEVDETARRAVAG